MTFGNDFFFNLFPVGPTMLECHYISFITFNIKAMMKILPYFCNNFHVCLNFLHFWD